MLLEKLYQKITAELREAGRDKARVRTALRHLLLRIELSSSPLEEWTPEYRAWMLETFCQALELAKADCVRSEEYEQAAEIQILLPDIQEIGIIESKQES